VPQEGDKDKARRRRKKPPASAPPVDGLTEAGWQGERMLLHQRLHELEKVDQERAELAEAIARLEAELADAKEERYELQLALRAAQMELDRLADGGDTSAPPSPPPGRAAVCDDKATQVGSGGSADGFEFGTPATPREPGVQLAELQGALKQATADYKMLLEEVGQMRGQVESRDRELADAESERQRVALRLKAADHELEHYKAEVARLEAQLAALARRLSECEAHRRKYEDLEATHNKIQQRLHDAKAADEHFNSQPSSPARPNRRDGGTPNRERVRYLPPTGF